MWEVLDLSFKAQCYGCADSYSGTEIRDGWNTVINNEDSRDFCPKCSEHLHIRMEALRERWFHTDPQIDPFDLPPEAGLVEVELIVGDEPEGDDER